MKIDDHWMRPRTKAGTEEMRKRLNAMRELLTAAAKTQTIESKIASKVFNEYFSFDWEEAAVEHDQDYKDMVDAGYELVAETDSLEEAEKIALAANKSLDTRPTIC